METIKCAVCKSTKEVKFIKITDCDLCQQCVDELNEGWEIAMRRDRENDPEL